jgi:hypothetical protein
MINGQGFIDIHPFAETLLSPSRFKRLQTEVASLNERKEAVSNEDRAAKYREAFAVGGDPHDRNAVLAGIVETININYWADNPMVMMADNKEITGDNNLIEIVNRSNQIWNVLTVSSHGNSPHQHLIRRNTVSRVEPYMIDTGLIKVPLFNSLVGVIDLVNEVMVEATMSLEQRRNTDLQALVDASFGTYPTGSEKTDARVVAGTRPTTSAINDASEGSLTLKVMQDAINHFILLKKSLMWIVVNPQDVRDTWEWQELVSTTSAGSQDGREMITTKMRQNIFDKGKPDGFYGMTFNWILDDTKAAGSMDVYSDAPVTNYTRPSLDESYIYDAKEMNLAGHGLGQNGIQLVELMKPVILTHQYRNALRVTFQ